MIQLLEFNRSRVWKAVKEILGEREKLTVEESKKVLIAIINNQDSVYQYLTPEDEKKLSEVMPDKNKLDLNEESETLNRLFSMFENVREDVDVAVVSNMLKILALVAESRQILHESGYERTQEKLFEVLFDSIFEKRKA